MKKQLADEELIDAIRMDDYTSFNLLFIRYYGSICRYVYRLIGNKQDTEDIVQNLFLYIWNSRRKLEIQESISGYLYTMAKNQTLNYLRKEANYQAMLEKQMQTVPSYNEDRLETDEFRAALNDCIDKLPEKSREIFLMDRVHDIKHAEIAEKLNITTKTVRNQLWNALQKLKNCILTKEI